VKYDSRTDSITDLEPHGILSLHCHFLYPSPGPINVSADCDFAFDGSQTKRSDHSTINFVFPLKVSASFMSPFVFYEIEAVAPFPAWDITIWLKGTEKRIVAHLLESGESVRGISELKTYQQTLTICWNLPFARDLRLQVPIPAQSQNVTTHPIRVSFSDVPRFVHMLVPFDVTLILQNETGKKVEGEVTVSLDEESIKIYGNNRIRFEKLEPKCKKSIPLTFIALLEGDFIFPLCIITIDGEETFNVRPTEGILIIGNG
jgi:hypothetical protein